MMQSLFLRHREIFWPSIPDPSVIFKPMMNENNDLLVCYTVIENMDMGLPALSTHCSLFFRLQEGICTRPSQNRSMLLKSDSYLKTTVTSIPPDKRNSRQMCCQKLSHLVCLLAGMRALTKRGFCLVWALSWSGLEAVHFLIFNLNFFLLAETAAVCFKSSLL